MLSISEYVTLNVEILHEKLYYCMAYNEIFGPPLKYFIPHEAHA